MDIREINEKNEMLLKQVVRYLDQLLEKSDEDGFKTYVEDMIIDGNILKSYGVEDYICLSINNNKGKLIINFDDHYNYIIKVKDNQGNLLKYELFSFDKEEFNYSSDEKVLRIKPIVLKLDSLLKCIDNTYCEIRVKRIDKIVEDILTR